VCVGGYAVVSEVRGLVREKFVLTAMTWEGNRSDGEASRWRARKIDMNTID
jgi:hypothetical protein